MRIALFLVVAAAAVAGGALVLVSGPAGGAGPATADVDAFPAVAAPGEARAAAPAAPAPCRAGDVVAMRSDDLAYAARARHALVARTAPGGRVAHRFGRLNVNGVPTVLGVLAARLDASCEPAWYRVQLPVRPNGATGWVDARDVRVTPVDTRIVVELAERRVTLFKAGTPLLQARAAIGRRGTPTPTGSYYVNQRLLAAEPGGPYGPGGIGISAFSPTLVNWAQGGPIAIHGTNAPHLIGEAVSSGCVRVDNQELLRLMELVPEGTPVLIR